MTATVLLRQLAEPALDAYQNTVTVTVPTRLLTALADELEAADRVAILYHDPSRTAEQNAEFRRRAFAFRAALAEVERAAKEHTSQ